MRTENFTLNLVVTWYLYQVIIIGPNKYTRALHIDEGNKMRTLKAVHPQSKDIRQIHWARLK